MSFANTPPNAKTSRTVAIGTKGVGNEGGTRNRIKSQVCSRVEHIFGVIKNVFHFT